MPHSLNYYYYYHHHLLYRELEIRRIVQLGKKLKKT